MVAPTRDDPFLRWASPVVGGPGGSRVATPAHPWWSAARVLVLVAAVTGYLAIVRAQHCRVEGWTTPGQFVHTCYSDVAVLYATLGGQPGTLLGLDPAVGDGLGQPALTSYVAALLAAVVAPLVGLSEALTGTGSADAAAVVDAAPRVYFDAYGALAAVALVVGVLAVVSLSGRRPWDALLVAASPVVVLSGLVSFDLLGVVLGVLAVALWARRWPLLAGVVLGAAVAARFHVVLVAVALVLLAIRGVRAREATVTLSAAAFAWAALNLPLALVAPQAWAAPARSWAASEPGYGSLLLVPRLLADEPRLRLDGIRAISATEASVVTMVLTVAVLAAVTWWVLRSPVPPRLPLVVLVLIVGTLVVSKTVPVQASLWLLPWTALAVPHWRDHLWWWAAEAVYVVSVWQYLVGLTETSRALPAGFYAAVMVGRLAAMAWLGWQAWQLGRHPDTDVVRRDAAGEDPVLRVGRGPRAAAPALSTQRPPVDSDVVQPA